MSVMEGEWEKSGPKVGNLVIDAMILYAKSRAHSEDLERQSHGAQPWTYKQELTRTLELLRDDCMESGRSFETCAQALAEKEKEHFEWITKIKNQVERETK